MTRQVHEKKIFSCPNAECDKTMERQHLKEHVCTCPYTVIVCKYKGIGCERPITFIMSEYQKKKNANFAFVSQSFYTSPNEDHMAVRV